MVYRLRASTARLASASQVRQPAPDHDVPVSGSDLDGPALGKKADHVPGVGQLSVTLEPASKFCLTEHIYRMR